MPLTLNIENIKDRADNYYETYQIDVSNEKLESLLESADGRIDVIDCTVRRRMPEGRAKSKVPMFLARKWGHFYEDRYEDTSGTHGTLFEEGNLVAPDMNLFDRVDRNAPPENEEHMMLPGSPAQNWCLEVEWESEANQRNKGFDNVNRLFSFTGAKNTKIEEIWLLIIPIGNKVVEVPELPNPLPIIDRSIERPPRNSKYFAIFVRELDPAVGIE
jgi:hypothetical protein